MRRPDGRAAAHCRVEVCPPSLLQGSALPAPGWRAGLRDWLSTGWSVSASGVQGPARGHAGREQAGDRRLCTVREEFLEALQDIHNQEVAVLRHRIGIAHSLRELWHLRPQLFELVALRFSQTEAQAASTR